LAKLKAAPPETNRVTTEMASFDKPVATKLPSPCVSICQMDPQDGVCIGCYRTRAEIAAWRSMDQDDQLVLLDILRDRRAKATGVARRPSRRNVKRLSV
jgi:predicted Fe-S protein YdhL (DUF1289 family)